MRESNRPAARPSILFRSAAGPPPLPVAPVAHVPSTRFHAAIDLCLRAGDVHIAADPLGFASPFAFQNRAVCRSFVRGLMVFEMSWRPAPSGITPRRPSWFPDRCSAPGCGAR